MAVKRRRPGRTSQPSGPVSIHPYWLGRGLKFLSLGNGLFWTLDGGWVGPTTLTGGPKNQTGKYDVSKGFGATYGTGTTDRIDAPKIALASGFRSVVSFSYANTTGGGGFGRIMQPLGTTGAGANDEAFYINGATSKFQYNRLDESFLGTYTIAGAAVTGAWKCYGVTQDQRTFGIAPALYEDGLAASVTTINTAASTLSTAKYTPTFGNRSTDSLRNWDGFLGPQAIFDHPSSGLTAAEHKALFENVWQVLAARFIRRASAGASNAPRYFHRTQSGQA